VDFVAVDSSLDDLEDASDDLDDPLEDLYDAAKIESSIRPQDNEIHFYKANSLTANEETTFANAIAGADVAVAVENVDSPTVGGDDQACEEAENTDHLLGCTFPPRGGQLIQTTPARSCTIGFIATGLAGHWTAGKQYIITAGHCIDGRENSIWSALVPNGQATRVGPSRTFANGPKDYGLIEIESTSDWHAAAPFGSVFQDDSYTNGVRTHLTQELKIRKVSLSPRTGPKLVCESSAFPLEDTGTPLRHTQCGKIEGFDGKHKGKKKQAEVEFCSVDGASGGPVYKDGIAYGIWSGTDKTLGIHCHHGFYEGLKGAEDHLEVHVVTNG
jgi:hypothetical protein